MHHPPQKATTLPGLLHSYPGSKYRSGRRILVPASRELVGTRKVIEYREPFVGCGGATAVLLSDVFQDVRRVVLNDADPWVANLWQVVISDPKALQDAILSMSPSHDELDRIQHLLDTTAPIPGDVWCAAMKIAAHRWTYHSLGAKGRARGNIGERWTPEATAKAVVDWNRLLTANGRETVVTCQHYREVIRGTGPEAFIYSDPPYVKAGPEVYAQFFQMPEHRDLSDELRETDALWMESYDNHPLIWGLYGEWADVRLTAPILYRHGAGAGERVRELVITPRLPRANRRAA